MLCGAVWFCVALCGAVWHCVMLCGVGWRYVVMCGAVSCCMVLHHAVWCWPALPPLGNDDIIYLTFFKAVRYRPTEYHQFRSSDMLKAIPDAYCIYFIFFHTSHSHNVWSDPYLPLSMIWFIANSLQTFISSCLIYRSQ